MCASRTNILWITIDSVRADHTSLHGYRRDTTPELARIAADSEGVNFKHGIAHGRMTPVSVPSMMTGLHPSRHRMMEDPHYARARKRAGLAAPDDIPESVETAPELLAEQDYRTVCVSENPYAGEGIALDERFDEFVATRRQYGGWKDAVKYVLNARKHGPGLREVLTDQVTLRDGSVSLRQMSFFTTNITKQKLSESTDTDEPFFCYAHYNDPHHPYRPPVSYLNEYTEGISATPEEALKFAEDAHDNRFEYMAEGVPFTDEQWEMLYAMYDAAIRYVDDCVGELFDFVQRNFEDTVVVITSDHGDLIGEENLLGHRAVPHDALVHVPLVVHGLKDVERCADEPTQHIDVMRTLLSLAGADVSQFQGYNLLEECRQIAVSQDLCPSDDDEGSNYKKIRKHNPDIDLSHLPKSRVDSFRTTDFKLVQTDEWEKLYRLPDESEDVRDEYPSVYEELSEFAREWLDTEGEPLDVTPSKSELNEETRQRLRDMGYLE